MKQDRIVKLWINHTNLLWSRLQTASVIEGGALAAAYQIQCQHKYWASALLIVAALLIFGVLLLLARDAQYIDAINSVNESENDEKIPIIPAPPKDLSIWDFSKTFEIPDGDIRKIGGRHIGFTMLSILIILNIIAAWRFSEFHFKCLFSN